MDKCAPPSRQAHELDHELYGNVDGDDIVYDYHQPKAEYQTSFSINPSETIADHPLNFTDDVALNFHLTEKQSLF